MRWRSLSRSMSDRSALSALKLLARKEVLCDSWIGLDLKLAPSGYCLIWGIIP